jgi:hypothetical protein
MKQTEDTFIIHRRGAPKNDSFDQTLKHDADVVSTRLTHHSLYSRRSRHNDQQLHFLFSFLLRCFYAIITEKFCNTQTKDDDDDEAIDNIINSVRWYFYH